MNIAIFICYTLEYFIRQGNPSVLKIYCSNGIHFATAKFHFNKHKFFYTRTKRKSSTNVTDFVRTFNRLIFIANFEIQPPWQGAKVCTYQNFWQSMLLWLCTWQGAKFCDYQDIWRNIYLWIYSWQGAKVCDYLNLL